MGQDHIRIFFTYSSNYLYIPVICYKFFEYSHVAQDHIRIVLHIPLILLLIFKTFSHGPGQFANCAQTSDFCEMACALDLARKTLQAGQLAILRTGQLAILHSVVLNSLSHFNNQSPLCQTGTLGQDRKICCGVWDIVVVMVLRLHL